MSVGSVQPAVMASEVSAEETDSVGEGEETETVAEEPAPQPEEPAPEPEEPAPQPEEPAPQPEEPAPQPEEVTPAEEPAAPEETPAEPAEEEVPEEIPELSITPTPTPSPEPEKPSIIENEKDLRTAISDADSGDSTTVIVLGGSFSLTSPVSIPDNKRIALVNGTGSNITIGRDEDFKGDMFQVYGRLSLQKSGSGSSGKIILDGSFKNSSRKADGSIINVEKKDSVFGMESNVTLKGNNTNAKGGAIFSHGQIILQGGTIAGNIAKSGGAIYTSSYVSVQGKVNVSDNRNEKDKKDNIALAGDAMIVVSDSLSSEARVCFRKLDHAEGMQAAALSGTASGNGVNLESLIGSVLVYEGSDLELDGNGVLYLPKAEEPEEVPAEEPAEEVQEPAAEELQEEKAEEPKEEAPAEEEAPTPEEEASAKPTLAKAEGGDPRWTSETTAEMVCVSDSDGWYYAAATSGDVPTFDVNQDGTPIKADEPFTVTFTDIDTDQPSLFVLVKSTGNELSDKKTATLTEPRPGTEEEGSEEPAADTEEEAGEETAPAEETDEIVSGEQNPEAENEETNESVSEEPSDVIIADENGEESTLADELYPEELNDGEEELAEEGAAAVGAGEETQTAEAKVEDSVVTGLENKKFAPGLYYPFEVNGAGEDNKEPKAGDVKWVKKGWNLDGSNDYSVDWELGFDSGLPTDDPFTLTIQMSKLVATEVETTNEETSETVKTIEWKAPEKEVLETFTFEVKPVAWATVTGLEESSKIIFSPGTYYKFNVKGYGEDVAEKDLKVDDVKWSKYSWSLDEKTWNRTFEIGYKDGKTGSKDIPITIRMRKYVYVEELIEEEDEKGNKTTHTETHWDPTDEYATIKYNVKHKEWTPTPSPKPGRDPVIADIDNTVVEGLGSRLALKPGVYYNFDVYGAGYKYSDEVIKTPYVDGDTRWKPVYWNQNGKGKNTTWKVGAKAGLNKKTSLKIRIYLQKQVYSGDKEKWVDKDEYDYIVATVYTKTYDEQRKAVITKVTDSVVAGLENALELRPNVFFPITVYGAGTAKSSVVIPEPYVTGDVRWVKDYWRMENGKTKQRSWRVGAPKGINEVREIPIRIYFLKQQYSETKGGWQSVGTGYVTAVVKTKTWVDEEENKNGNKKNGSGSGGHYYSGGSGRGSSSGSGSDDDDDDSSSSSLSDSTSGRGTGNGSSSASEPMAISHEGPYDKVMLSDTSLAPGKNTDSVSDSGDGTVADDGTGSIDGSGTGEGIYSIPTTTIFMILSLIVYSVTGHMPYIPMI